MHARLVVCRSGTPAKKNRCMRVWSDRPSRLLVWIRLCIAVRWKWGELLALWSLLIHHSSEAICSLDIVCTSLLFVHDSLFTAHLTSSLLTFSREIWAPFSPSFFPRKNRPEITPFFWVRKRGSSLWMSPRPSLNCDRKMALFLGPQSRRILNVAGQCVSPSVSIYFWIGR